MMMKRYDCIVIGGGPGGIRAAELLGGAGKSVCLLEAGREHLGGTCLHQGCIPVKSLLNSARLFREMADSSCLEIAVPAADTARFLKLAREKIEILRRGILHRLAASRVEVVHGRGSFSGPRRVRVEQAAGGGRELEGAAVIVATGSAPAGLPGLDPDGERIITSDGLLEQGLQGEDIVIAGGGYIGCEYAAFFSDIGVAVTLVEFRDQLLPGEDGDIARTLARELKRRGVRVLTGRKVEGAGLTQGGVQIRISGTGGGETLFGKRLLVAAGRRAALAGLNLALAGVEVCSGFIRVDRSMMTSAPGVYAVGDVVSSPMLAHTATREAEAAVEAILGRPVPEIDYSLVPRVVFSRPQVGAIGLTEAQAQARGYETAAAKNHFKANALAVLTDREAGFAKLIYDRSTHRILGAGVVGPEAVELIHLVAFPLKAGASLEEFRESIFAHPTLAEIWG